MCTQLDDANCGYLKCCCLLRPHGVSRGLPVQQLLTSDQIQSKYLNQNLIGWKSRSEFCAVNLFFLWENTSASLAVDKICVYCFFYQKVFLTSIFKNTWLFLDHAYWSEMDRCTVSRWVMIFESDVFHVRTFVQWMLPAEHKVLIFVFSAAASESSDEHGTSLNFF